MDDMENPFLIAAGMIAVVVLAWLASKRWG
ncbi:hypothetical protein GGC47_005322 [Bosea sp. OAE752]